MKNVHDYSKDFDTFILDMFSGRLTYGSWQEHINSWLYLKEKSTIPIDLIKIRYESLLENPVKEIEKISKFMELNKSEQDLIEAVEISTPDKMRIRESKTNFGKWKEQTDYSFIGKAVSKQWESILTEDQLNLIYYFAEKEMIKLGYEI